MHFCQPHSDGDDSPATLNKLYLQPLSQQFTTDGRPFLLSNCPKECCVPKRMYVKKLLSVMPLWERGLKTTFYREFFVYSCIPISKVIVIFQAVLITFPLTICGFGQSLCPSPIGVMAKYLIYISIVMITYHINFFITDTNGEHRKCYHYWETSLGSRKNWIYATSGFYAFKWFINKIYKLFIL